MRNPCLSCTLLGADKNGPECMACEKRVAYVHGMGRESDMGAMVRTVGSKQYAVSSKKTEGKRMDKQAEKSNGTKNKLINLNDHLFMQIERLTDGEITGDKLTVEIVRSKALSQLACQIILNARLALDASVKINESMIKNPPKMLGSQGYDEKA